MPVLKEKKNLCVPENFEFVTFLNQNSKSSKILIPCNGELNLKDRKLVCVNLDGCPSVKKIYLSNNNLSQIDLSGCKDLEELDVSHNKLTNLDISKNPNLKNLSCNDNQLTKLDISNNKHLAVSYYKIVAGNKFSEEITSKNKKDLLEITTKKLKSTKIKEYSDYKKCLGEAFAELCIKDKTYYGWDIDDVFPITNSYTDEYKFINYLIANIKGINDEYLKFIQTTVKD